MNRDQSPIGDDLPTETPEELKLLEEEIEKERAREKKFRDALYEYRHVRRAFASTARRKRALDTAKYSELTSNIPGWGVAAYETGRWSADVTAKYLLGIDLGINAKPPSSEIILASLAGIGLTYGIYKQASISSRKLSTISKHLSGFISLYRQEGHQGFNVNRARRRLHDNFYGHESSVYYGVKRRAKVPSRPVMEVMELAEKFKLPPEPVKKPTLITKSFDKARNFLSTCPEFLEACRLHKMVLKAPLTLLQNIEVGLEDAFLNAFSGMPAVDYILYHDLVDLPEPRKNKRKPDDEDDDPADIGALKSYFNKGKSYFAKANKSRENIIERINGVSQNLNDAADMSKGFQSAKYKLTGMSFYAATALIKNTLDLPHIVHNVYEGSKAAVKYPINCRIFSNSPRKHVLDAARTHKLPPRAMDELIHRLLYDMEDDHGRELAHNCVQANKSMYYNHISSIVAAVFAATETGFSKLHFIEMIHKYDGGHVLPAGVSALTLVFVSEAFGEFFGNFKNAYDEVNSSALVSHEYEEKLYEHILEKHPERIDDYFGSDNETSVEVPLELLRDNPQEEPQLLA